MQGEEATPTSSREKLGALKAAVDGKDKVEAAAVLGRMRPKTVNDINIWFTHSPDSFRAKGAEKPEEAERNTTGDEKEPETT